MVKFTRELRNTLRPPPLVWVAQKCSIEKLKWEEQMYKDLTSNLECFADFPNKPPYLAYLQWEKCKTDWEGMYSG